MYRIRSPHGRRADGIVDHGLEDEGRNGSRVPHDAAPSEGWGTEANEDGFGPAWPLTYQELEPWYDWLDDNLGRCGPSEDHPSVPAGRPQPPQACMRASSGLAFT